MRQAHIRDREPQLTCAPRQLRRGSSTHGDHGDRERGRERGRGRRPADSAGNEKQAMFHVKRDGGVVLASLMAESESAPLMSEAKPSWGQCRRRCSCWLRVQGSGVGCAGGWWMRGSVVDAWAGVGCVGRCWMRGYLGARVGAGCEGVWWASAPLSFEVGPPIEFSE